MTRKRTSWALMFLTMAVAAVFSPLTVSADIVLAFTAANSSGSLGPSDVSAGVSAMNLSRSTGLSSATSTNSYRSRGFASSETRNTNDYLEWGFTSTIPYNLTSLDLAFQRGSENFGIVVFDGPRDVEIDLSVNGGPFVTIGGLNDFGTSVQVLSTDLSTYSNVTEATFRIYPHQADAIGSFSGYFDFLNSPSLDNRSIIVNGVAAVPEPSAFLFGLLVCAVVGTGSYVRHRFAKASGNAVAA